MIVGLGTTASAIATAATTDGHQAYIKDGLLAVETGTGASSIMYCEHG